MSERYITITPKYFENKPGRIAGIKVEFEGEIAAIKWRGLEIPSKLRILRGYRRPDYSGIGQGLPEFNEWVERTLVTQNKNTIRDTIKFLELKRVYFEWLPDEECFTKDARIHRRLSEGLDKLKKGLELLTST